MWCGPMVCGPMWCVPSPAWHILSRVALHDVALLSRAAPWHYQLDGWLAGTVVWTHVLPAQDVDTSWQGNTAVPHHQTSTMKTQLMLIYHNTYPPERRIIPNIYSHSQYKDRNQAHTDCKRLEISPCVKTSTRMNKLPTYFGHKNFFNNKTRIPQIKG